MRAVCFAPRRLLPWPFPVTRWERGPRTKESAGRGCTCGSERGRRAPAPPGTVQRDVHRAVLCPLCSRVVTVCDPPAVAGPRAVSTTAHTPTAAGALRCGSGTCNIKEKGGSAVRDSRGWAGHQGTERRRGCRPPWPRESERVPGTSESSGAADKPESRASGVETPSGNHPRVRRRRQPSRNAPTGAGLPGDASRHPSQERGSVWSSAGRVP